MLSSSSGSEYPTKEVYQFDGGTVFTWYCQYHYGTLDIQGLTLTVTPRYDIDYYVQASQCGYEPSVLGAQAICHDYYIACCWWAEQQGLAYSPSLYYEAKRVLGHDDLNAQFSLEELQEEEVDVLRLLHAISMGDPSPDIMQASYALEEVFKKHEVIS